jgi:hypothetical protein
MGGKTMLMAWLALAAECSVARSDGGALRFSERRDGYCISVFTSPTPLRAGSIDISVLVQDATTGKPLPDVPIVVYVEPVNHWQQRISAKATSAQATNKFFQSAQLELSVPGLWHVEVVVQGTKQDPKIGFDVEVGAPQLPWLDMSLWIGWPLAPIAFFVLHKWLVHRHRPSVQIREKPGILDQT